MLHGNHSQFGKGQTRYQGHIFHRKSEELRRKFEKVARGIQGLKSRTYIESSEKNWSQRLEHHMYICRKCRKGGWNQVSGRTHVPCWHATPFENVPLTPFVIR